MHTFIFLIGHQQLSIYFLPPRPSIYLILLKHFKFQQSVKTSQGAGLRYFSLPPIPRGSSVDRPITAHRLPHSSSSYPADKAPSLRPTGTAVAWKPLLIPAKRVSKRSEADKGVASVRESNPRVGFDCGGQTRRPRLLLICQQRGLTGLRKPRPHVPIKGWFGHTRPTTEPRLTSSLSAAVHMLR